MLTACVSGRLSPRRSGMAGSQVTLIGCDPRQGRGSLGYFVGAGAQRGLEARAHPGPGTICARTASRQGGMLRLFSQASGGRKALVSDPPGAEGAKRDPRERGSHHSFCAPQSQIGKIPVPPTRSARVPPKFCRFATDSPSGFRSGSFPSPPLLSGEKRGRGAGGEGSPAGRFLGLLCSERNTSGERGCP